MTQIKTIDAVVNYVKQIHRGVGTFVAQTKNKLEKFELYLDDFSQRLINADGKLKELESNLEKLTLRVSMLSNLVESVDEMTVLLEGREADPDKAGDKGVEGLITRMRQAELRTDIIDELRADQTLLARALIQYSGYVNQLVSISLIEQQRTVEDYQQLGWKVKAMRKMERRTRTDYAEVLKKTMQSRKKALTSSEPRQKALQPSSHPRNSYFKKKKSTKAKPVPPARRSEDVGTKKPTDDVK